MAKLWSGRFGKTTARSVDEFSASLPYDQRLYAEDIAGSIAHARMLGRQGIISRPEADTLIAGLAAVRQGIEQGKVAFSIENEDIHTSVEAALRERVGNVAGKLHTARSRNDQVALDMRLYVRGTIDTAGALLADLQRALLKLAGRYEQAIVPGYTHTQRAQPVLFAHHLLAYFEMLQRDKSRLADCRARLNLSPLGSGALAGVTFPIDRQATAAELGFAGPTRNSLDAVSDRDFVVEFLAAAGLIMAHLSRLSEEIVLWSTAEFGLLVVDDAYAGGSSMMPQKKNAAVAELTRGRAGRVYGHLLALLTTLKGLPLAYNQDLQEDKEGLFDAVDMLLATLRIYAEMVRTLSLNEDAARQAARGGFMMATDLADWLARQGLPFRQAHEAVGKLVAYCIEQGKDLADLSLAELQSFSAFFREEALAVTTPEAAVAARDVYGGTAPAQVQARLAEARRLLAEEG